MKSVFFGGHEAKACASATIFIRLAVGLAVFFPEGLQKLLFADILGAGRFAGIGIPLPGFFGPFVGVVECLCGLMIIFGVATRLATIPLIITMCVALLSTKLPILLGHDWWIFRVSELGRYGFWSAQHEARADMVMLLSLIFLLIAGAGRWSVDHWLWNRQKTHQGTSSTHC
ncbi:DoxX family protein [Microbulbifer spongiae]|uniref:DoxX family protein n=1 Tax=Microbulbifer spongiae TaxID=2944933 RepID=A0ABY9EE40_9GAMM|nr:DoxX family protein [Microbulbifer sp. MI-G]WKD51240.1 DoxX family protein [Microbulbifer sp. MI-G]